MKTEILVQMDGLAKSDALVFVLAATNLPWELDMAMLRRLEKRIMVPLPCVEGRGAILDSLLGDRTSPACDLKNVATRTEGYSGSDMYLLAKEAAMRPLRRVMTKLEGMWKEGSGKGGGDGGPKVRLEDVGVEDLEGALQVSKPSAVQYGNQYVEFSEKYGVIA